MATPYSPRQQGEGRSVLSRRHDSGDASPRRSDTPCLPSHYLLRLQAVRDARAPKAPSAQAGKLFSRQLSVRASPSPALGPCERNVGSRINRDQAPMLSPPASSSSAATRCDDAPTATRREFVTALKAELPAALAHLQRGNIAPVDLAQAAIGPGMAVYTRYSKVLDAEGKPLSVREALALINQTLDESLAEQEGDFDADSRWALAWFEHAGFAEGEYGVAETLSTAKNTSVAGLVEAGIVASSRARCASQGRRTGIRLGPDHGPKAHGVGDGAPPDPHASKPAAKAPRPRWSRSSATRPRSPANSAIGSILSASERSGRPRRWPTTAWC